MMVFSDKLIAAIQIVSSQLVADMEYEDSKDAFIVAEMTLDGDRLEMNGFKEENKEMKALCAESSWTRVVEEAKKYVCTT